MRGMAKKRKTQWPLLILIGAVVAVAALVVWLSAPTMASEDADIVVYKTPTCGCCNNWVAHLRNSGLEVSVINTQPIRSRVGVPRKLGSCHPPGAWLSGEVERSYPE